VPIPDDDRFEEYLKQFRPLTPDPLTAMVPPRTSRRRIKFGAWAMAAASIVAAGFFVLYPSGKSGQTPDAETIARIKQLPESQPLTIGRANELLTAAPSLKAAVDNVAAQALQSRGSSLPENKQSALVALGKEKAKL
jgi:hypothetical protein